MADAKHTPGPLESDLRLASEHGAYNDGQAKLFLSAADAVAVLSMALQNLVDCYCSAGPDLNEEERQQHRRVLATARAVIAKATGSAA